MPKRATMPTEWHHGGVRGGLQLKAVYGIAELARSAGVSRQFLHRLLPKAGVKLVRHGGFVLVPLQEIKRCIPELWKAIIVVEQQRLEIWERHKAKRESGRES